MDSVDWGNPDEWELVNDDGFVYKRRRTLPESNSISSHSNQQPDPEVERKNLRERKRKTLLKLGDKYLKEIQQWELLTSTVETKAQLQLQERPEPHITTISNGLSISEEDAVSSRRRLLEDILTQVEADEAFTQSVWKLCDLVDAVCDADETSMNQQFTDLPIWEPTPDEFMAALCVD